MHRRTQRTHRCLKALTGAWLAACCLLLPAVHVGAEEAEKVQELKRLIEEQQSQLESQQRQLEAQMQMLKKLQSEVERYGESADKESATPREGTAPAGAVESPEAPRPKETGVAQTDRFDSEDPTGSDITYFDPTKVINIPGTETSIGLHGFVQFQIIHDTNGPAGNQFDTAFIPVDDVPSETKFNVNPSRLAFSSATQIPDGQLNTLISIDFNGQVDRPDPRLRLAYGEYVNEGLRLGVLAGQTFATMADLVASPETVDFAVPAGSWAQRQPLLRFTKSFHGGFLFESSLETPQNVRYINAEKRTRLPDAVLAGTWKFNGDYFRHFRLNALARDLRAQGVDGTTDSALGWAVAASTKLGLPFLGKRDNLRLAAHYGEGYGTQLKGGPEEALFDTANSELDMIGISSVFGGIQHFWTEEVPLESDLRARERRQSGLRAERCTGQHDLRIRQLHLESLQTAHAGRRIPLGAARERRRGHRNVQSAAFLFSTRFLK